MSSDQRVRQLVSAASGRTRPRFGLVQLLLWIACCAAYLAILRAMASDIPRPLGVLFILGLVVSVGTAWAGTILLALRGALRARWPIEPGHWLLLVMGTRSAVEVLIGIPSQEIFAHPELVLRGIECWLFVLPLCSRRLENRWKAYFLLMVLLDGAPLLLACLAVLGAGHGVTEPAVVQALVFAKAPVAVGALLTTSILDMRSKSGRDWMHWGGVCAAFFILIFRMTIA